MGIILLVLLLLSAWGSADAANTYDYMQFVMQWPPTYCRLNPGFCIPSSYHPIYFTVHGLWPSNYSNNPGRDCVGTQFSQTEMLSPANQDLVTYLLSAAWPQLRARDSNINFWKTQYNKHGTCSENNLNQTEYFKKAYWMWSHYNAHQLFLAAQIYPGNQYYLTDLEQAIQRVTWYQPVLKCARIKISGNDYWLLKEVIICFDVLGNNFVPCGRQTDCIDPVVSYFT